MFEGDDTNIHPSITVTTHTVGGYKKKRKKIEGARKVKVFNIQISTHPLQCPSFGAA